MSLVPRITQVLVEPPDENIWHEYFVGLVNRVGPIAQKPKLLDLACGHAGSGFVNEYASGFPDTEVFSLDMEPLVLNWLDAPRKICADARRIPFRDQSFDMVWDGYSVLELGILSDAESYFVAKEIRRILTPEGAFIFSHLNGRSEAETIENLVKIGFKKITHLLRLSQRVREGYRHRDSYLMR